MLRSEEFQKSKKTLLKIIKEKSYREGNFTLASGKKSNFYLDLKETTLNQEGIFLVGQLLAQLIVENKIIPYAVGGMTMGADPIATAVCLALRERGISSQSYIVRKQPKSHGTLAWVEGAKTYPAGAELVILEDVVTTGGSSLLAAEKLVEAGFKVVAVVSVMDREEGAREAIEGRGMAFFSLCSLSELRG
jgi:orotate phosphoribosyltransferase